MELPAIEIQIKTLPKGPGVYQYFDAENRVIYVGKAKNLKKRVGSYFTKQHLNSRTRMLVKNIIKVEHIVVASEMDALLLENNLIKKYQPKYNVMLKDDKSYPWICVKKEPFPRVFPTRKIIRDGSEYFGPYTSMKTVRTLLDLIKGIYPLRTCNYDLHPSKIAADKYKLCLEYHLGNCLGPCVGNIELAVYEENIHAIRSIIKGNFKESLQRFKTQMKSHAEQLEFEAAQRIRDKIEVLENYQAKSTIVNPKISDVNVFTILSDESYGYVNFLQISYGSIIRSHTIEIKKRLEETDGELLRLAIIEIRQRFHLQSKVIFSSHPLDFGEEIQIILPQKGDKRKLVELSLRNAKYFRMERFKQMKIVDPDRHEKRLMAQMKTDLRLSSEPVHIECFDNSNIQGSNPVAACVVFKNGKPSKKEYRHFKIKTVEGPDDFASMEEVVFRRYRRLLEEDEALPQLIIIDGGKGQLSSALKSLEILGLRGKIAIIGIAKRLEELYFPEDPIPLYLDKKSETLKVIQQLRNEAHRFGITLHRNRRSKGALGSELDQIPGVGPKTKEVLLKEFKSLKRIKAAPKEALIEVLGPNKGNALYKAINSPSAS